MTLSIITRNTNVSITGRQPRGLSPAFSRASTAYQSDGRKVGVGVPRFETADGRRGVLVEEGTVNLITNPAFVQGLDGWARNQDAALDHVVLEGKSWCKVTSNQVGSTPGVLSGWIPVSANATYTFSLTGFVGQGTTSVYAYVNGNVTSNVVWSRPSSRLGTSPSRKVEVFNTGDNTKLRVGALWSGVAIGDWFEVTEMQLEKKPYVTSFVDGVRTAEVLSLAESVWSLDAGTFECWAKVAASDSSKTITLQWDPTGSPASRFGLWVNSDGTLTFNYAGSSTDSRYFIRSADRIDDNQWHHCAATWDQRAIKLFTDGVVVGDKVVPTIIQNNGGRRDHILPIGRRGWTYNDEYLNGLISDLRIYSRTLSAEEIASHAAGNIVASDCYHYPFNGDLWPAPGSLGAVVSPTMTTRSGQAEVVTRRGNVDIITRPGKLEVIGR